MVCGKEAGQDPSPDQPSLTDEIIIDVSPRIIHSRLQRLQSPCLIGNGRAFLIKLIPSVF